MTHYIFTRFSILDKDHTGYVIGGKPKKYTSEIMFSKTRLDFKFNIFDKITYPSIKNQTCQNYIWAIFASIYLPDEYKERLNKYECYNIKIIYVTNFAEMNANLKSIISQVQDYTTIRLDDDDGLNLNYLESLNKYITEKGKIISFPNGIKFTVENNIIKFGSKIKYKNNAQGMTGIGFDIYSAGNHTQVHKSYTVIYDNMEDAYNVCNSEFCVNNLRK